MVVNGAPDERSGFCEALAAKLGGRVIELRALKSAEMAAATPLGLQHRRRGCRRRERRE